MDIPDKNKSIIVANTETGEVMQLKPIEQNPNHIVHINTKQKFIKIFPKFILILTSLSQNELIIMEHIFLNLKPNKLQVAIEPTSLSKSKSIKQIKIAINSLTKKNIITKTKVENIYTINHEFFINGKYFNLKEQISMYF